MKNIFGWIGMVLIICAYGLSSFQVISVTTWIYQVLNLVGSGGIIITAYNNRDNPAMVLNIIWAIIAIISLFHV